VYHRHHLHFTSPEGSTFLAPLAYFWRFLYIKAMHNLKTKKFGHHPHTMGYMCAFSRISTVFGF